MFIVTLVHLNIKHFLRGTTWTGSLDRAFKYDTEEQAAAALVKAAQFMKPSQVKKCLIEKV